MAKDIKVNSLQIMHAAAQVQVAGLSLDTALDTWTSQGENSIALEAFARQFLELERTIGLLQDMVYKDSADVTKAAGEMFLSDLNLARLWK